MPLIDGRAWVLQLLEMDNHLVERNTPTVRHGSAPGSCCRGSHSREGTQEPHRAQALQPTRITYKCALALGSIVSPGPGSCSQIPGTPDEPLDFAIVPASSSSLDTVGVTVTIEA